MFGKKHTDTIDILPGAQDHFADGKGVDPVRGALSDYMIEQTEALKGSTAPGPWERFAG